MWPGGVGWQSEIGAQKVAIGGKDRYRSFFLAASCVGNQNVNNMPPYRTYLILTILLDQHKRFLTGLSYAIITSIVYLHTDLTSDRLSLIRAPCRHPTRMLPTIICPSTATHLLAAGVAKRKSYIH